MDPQHPYSRALAPFTVPGHVATPCDGLSWEQLWSHASAYRIGAVVSDWQLGAQPRTVGLGARDGLLTAEAPFAAR